MSALCFEAGADGYVCVETSTTRTLIWQVARAVERNQLIFTNRRLAQAERHRLQLEHEEANRLLAQQRSLLKGLAGARQQSQQDKAATATSAPSAHPDHAVVLPVELTNHYRELLRAYVVMGSGRLAEELIRLADLLVSAGVTAPQAMHLHLGVLEQMVLDLGSRSARHVMNRADLLVLEVMMNLAEGYRRRSHEEGRRRQALSAGLDLESSAA